MFSDADLLPLSALQHLAFCERQCALIHIEQAWSENRFTAEGRIMHEHVHEQGYESRGMVRIERGVFLKSLRLGLVGQADVVEFHQIQDGWQPFPVEYKRGKPKANRCDEIQLCAQALCLEEMLDQKIPNGALFYGKTRRRKEVCLDQELRELTISAARSLHALVKKGVIPPAIYDKRCKSCSLADVCMPGNADGTHSARAYLDNLLRMEEGEEETE